MGSVTVYTAERMRQIEDNTITGAEVIDGDLILMRYDGSTLNAGAVGGAGGGLSEAEVEALIDIAINQVIDGAPGAVNTLNELAAAMGDDPSFASTMTTALAGKQPLHATLTLLAAISTTAIGRSLLGAADAAALQTIIQAQPADSDLTAIAALSTTAIGRSLLAAADAPALQAIIGAQPSDADLTAIAALTTTAVGRSLLAAADAAALQAIVGAQPADADLTAISALTTTAIGRSLLAAADAAALRTIISSPAAASLASIVTRKSDANLTLAVNANYQDIDPSGTANARDLDIVIPNVAVGQWIEGSINTLITSSTVAMNIDFFTIVAGAAVHKFGDPTSLTGPSPGAWQPEVSKTLAIMGKVPYQVQAGDIEAGSVRIRVKTKQTSGAARVIFSAGGGLLLLEGRGPF